ncbi:MAG: hypothetical protein ACX93P_09060 [Roseovarius sp.]|nr:hypothetical protein [Roseovarius sp.]
MEALPVILGLVAVIVLVAALARSRAVSERKPARGCDPGQGDQLVDIGYASGGAGGGHGGVIRVTRDPQQYARGFVPASAQKPNRNETQ